MQFVISYPITEQLKIPISYSSDVFNESFDLLTQMGYHFKCNEEVEDMKVLTFERSSIFTPTLKIPIVIMETRQFRVDNNWQDTAYATAKKLLKDDWSYAGYVQPNFTTTLLTFQRVKR